MFVLLYFTCDVIYDYCTGLTTLTAIAISVVATIFVIAISAISICLVFVIMKYCRKMRLTQGYNNYDVPYNYTLPPLPPRVHRMDSGIYDTISNCDRNDVESETTFSNAAVNSNVCNRISFTHEQSKIENGDVSSTGVIDATGTEILQNNYVSESESIQNPPDSLSDGSGVQENNLRVRENRTIASTGNINTEGNREVNESVSIVGALGLQRNQEGEGQVDATNIQTYSGEESTTCAEVRMQENASYQPSTKFVLIANPAYGTDIAIAPEISTEDNIAYQHMCNDQLRSNADESWV